MDINGLSKALAVFGMIIDTDRDLQKFVLKQFDLDNTGSKEIDYNDFSATMSSIIASKEEEALLLLFQIFDNDQDGYLELEDIALILLSTNQIAVVATGQKDNFTTTVNKRQCLKQSKKMIANHNLNEDKVSFDEFKNMMINKTEKDMMFDHMQHISVSYQMAAPRISVL